WGGGTGAHGFESQEGAFTTVPPPIAHSWVVTSSHPASDSSSTNAPVELPGKQHTTSSPPPGGVVAHGLGIHEMIPACVIPPAAAPSSGLSTPPSPPQSSGTQQANAPAAESSSPGMSPSRSSSPLSSRTSIVLPRGSTPRKPSDGFGCVLSVTFPLPAALVVKLPTLTPPTTR